jgi:hypothetical protein
VAGPSSEGFTAEGTGNPGQSRRGRPPGSTSLTPQIQHLIVSYIQAGATDHAAAEAAEISDRTFYDWIARGEGTHPSRPSTPKLRRFAQAVRQAKAIARVGAETRVYQERPAYWLAHAARSKPGREGWTDPGPEQEQRGPTLEERIAERERGEKDPDVLIHALENGNTLAERVAAWDLRRAREAAPVPDCPDPTCPCTHHKRREELP